MPEEAIDSLSFIRSHWTAWWILGVAHKRVQSWRSLYVCLSVLANVMVTVGYPLHLGLSLFRNRTLTEDILNLTTFVTCLACSAKCLIYAYNIDKVARMEQLLRLLDERVSGEKQRAIYGNVKLQLRIVLYVFIGIYMPCGLFAELSFLFKEQRGLMYPAYFPFDWLTSTRNYYMANVYQIVGISFQLLQNYVSDCFPAVVLCLISSHVKMLYSRFEEIGRDPSINAEKQLEDCITDHKRLLELFRCIERLMSVPMFIQFTVTALNVCISIAALVFYVSEPMARTYLIFYALAMPLQIFPSCYFGTDNEFWFGRLHYAAFSCDWPQQGRSFKRKMMFFVERSLKQSTAIAGGMLRIHLDTFFSTLKMAYSLFTIIIRMRK
ncbi:GL17561 [Drosophila persimilis]|uniref:Odorant receptor n=1 Tax=Drosophila persimilis TaxID=7234 RepID=B4GHN3_DROPE|nr:odorant receptor 59a [Drosophila persimilis]EDW36003.1 GL17561 [Drosophila persimilis]